MCWGELGALTSPQGKMSRLWHDTRETLALSGLCQAEFSPFLFIFIFPSPPTSPSRAPESLMLLTLSDRGEGLLGFFFLAQSNAVFKASNCILVNTLWLFHSGDMITFWGMFPKVCGFTPAGPGHFLWRTWVTFTHQPALREASWFSHCSTNPTAEVRPWLCPSHEPRAVQQALPTSCSRAQPQRTLTPGSEVKGTT